MLPDLATLFLLFVSREHSGKNHFALKTLSQISCNMHSERKLLMHFLPSFSVKSSAFILCLNSICTWIKWYVWVKSFEHEKIELSLSLFACFPPITISLVSHVLGYIKSRLYVVVEGCVDWIIPAIIILLTLCFSTHFLLSDFVRVLLNAQRASVKMHGSFTEKLAMSRMGKLVLLCRGFYS